jgi:SAM-dependent methyltransferase
VIGRLLRLGAQKTVGLSLRGFRRGPHITRYAMYARLAEVLGRERGAGRVLSISHSTHLARFLPRFAECEVVEANFPEHSILALPFADASFDFVVSDQVLEHVAGNPQTAVDECRRVLRPGGLAVHTTCFINPVHGPAEEWPDLWRFTPDALRLLHARFAEVVEAGGWGNRWVWVVDALGLRRAGVPESRWHPFHRIAVLNDERWPVSTWIVARR